MENPKDTMDVISGFLSEVRDKFAAEESYQEDSMNDVKSNDKKVAKDTQTNLGLEMSEDAKDAGSTIEDESDNTDALATSPVDNQGTHTLTTDDPIASKGNVGPIVHQEISQTQKTASDAQRINSLGNALLTTLSKTAAEIDAYAGGVQKQASHEKTATDLHVESATSEFAHFYRMGLEKRAQDEAELEKVAGWDREIAHLGGREALLDKIAMETPEAVLPPEALAGEEAGEEAPLDGSELQEEIGEAELDQIAEALAAEGITPEELEMAIQDAQALESEGVGEEELAQALGGDAESGMGEVEKTANQNSARVDVIRQFIFRQR